MQKRHQRIYEMLGPAEPATKKVDVKKQGEELQVVDMMEPPPASEFGSQVIEAMKNVREALYPTCSFHNTDFQELVEGCELTHVNTLLDYADLLLSDPSHDVPSGLEDADAFYNVLHFESMADVVGFL